MNIPVDPPASEAQPRYAPHVGRAAARPEGGTKNKSEDYGFMPVTLPAFWARTCLMLITDTVHTVLLHARVGRALRLGCGGF